MRNILLLTALSMLLIIGCNNSNKAEQQEDNTVTDSLETARQDSIQKAEAEAKLNEEREAAEQQKRDEEAEQFCRQLSIEDLLDLLEHYGGAKIVQNGGLTFIYEDEIESTDGDVGEEQIVYGRDIEKGDKKNFGYDLKCTSGHACYYEINLDTSTNPSLCFADKDDADAFYDRAAKCETIDMDGTTYYIHPKDDGQIYIETPYGDGDFNTHFALSRPEKNGDFYRISVEVYM